MARRARINYNKLLALQERMVELGITWENLPPDVIDAPWFEQRDYFQNELGLAYCVTCKLPIPNEQASPSATDMCIKHRELQIQVWDRIHATRTQTPYYKLGSTTRSQLRYRRRKEREERTLLRVQELADIGMQHQGRPDPIARLRSEITRSLDPNSPLKSVEVTGSPTTTDGTLDVENFLDILHRNDKKGD